MKVRPRIPVLVLASLALLPVARAADGQLTLPDFKELGGKASESVNITLDSSLIALATRFLDAGKPNDAAVRQAIGGVRGIYVRNFTFDTNFAYPREVVSQVRKQLSLPDWQPLVHVHSQKDHNDVDIYVCIEQGKASGLAIIASEPRQLTIVNIVGSIDLQKLHALEGSFGIPKVSLEDKK